MAKTGACSSYKKLAAKPKFGRGRRLGLQLALVVGCGPWLAGCFFMPKEAGVRLQTDMVALRGEVARLRTAQEQELAAKREHDGQSDAQLARIQKRLDETSKTSSLAEADMGTQLDRMLEDVAKLRGAIEENDHRIGETETKLEQKLAERVEALKKAGEQRQRDEAARAAKKAIPAGKKDQLGYGRKLIKDGRNDEGRAILRELTRRFGKERGIGDEALLTLGIDAEASGKLDVALRDYVRLLSLFATGSHADEAYFRAASCLQATAREEEARTFFTEVVTNFPKSSWAKQAKQRLAAMPAAKPAKSTAGAAAPVPAAAKPGPQAPAAAPPAVVPGDGNAVAPAPK